MLPLFTPNSSLMTNNKAAKISAILLRPHLLEGSHVKPCEISVIYVCELHEIRGKFNKEKADALGLTVKEKYRILQRGYPVKSDLLDIMGVNGGVKGKTKLIRRF